jgi:ParB family transcriptional regulator, chromosome partitioning protein
MELEIAHLDRKYDGLRIEDRVKLGRLTASLLEHGQKSPVLVVGGGEGDVDRHVLVDGYQRVRALGRLGRDLVTAARLEMEEADALMLCRSLDSRGQRSALEEGWFLRELVEGHGLRASELAVRLERSPSWVSRRLSLAKLLPARVQEAVQKGRVRPQAAMKVLVPLARANAEACEHLVARLGGEPWSVRQMERLYRAWRRGDPEQRARILEHPELYRKIDEELGESEHGTDDLVDRDLGILYGVSIRLRGRLHEGALDLVDDKRRRRIGRSWQRTREAMTELGEKMEEKLAGPRHPGGDLSAP